MLRKSINFLITEFVLNGHMQSLGAVGIVCVSYYFFFSSSVFRLDLILISYLLFECVYIFDRFVDINHDFLTNFRRSSHIKKYFNYVPIILFVMLLLLFSLLFIYANMISVFTVAVIVGFGFLYPIFFKKLTKRIPLFKNFYVSSVFALMVFLPAIYFENYAFDLIELVVFFACVFFEAFIGQIVLDMKDLESDKRRQILTLPVMVGMKKSLFIVNLLSLLNLLVFTFLFLYLNFVLGIYLLLVISFMVNYLSVVMVKKNQKSAYLAQAGKFFVWFLGYLIVNMIV